MEAYDFISWYARHGAREIEGDPREIEGARVATACCCE
jgi:hypothetical protein